MINFRVENIEKTVDYLREVGTEIIDEISSYPYGKFVNILIHRVMQLICGKQMITYLATL